MKVALLITVCVLLSSCHAVGVSPAASSRDHASSTASLSAVPSTTVGEPEALCNGNTVAFERCVAAVFDGVEAERTSLFSMLLDQPLRPNWTPRLLEQLHGAEDAFVGYREATCASVYEQYIGGTIRGAASVLCKIDLTRDHNRFLAQRVRP